MIDIYRQHVEERKVEGLPPLPLEADQVTALIELLKSSPTGDRDFLLELLIHRVPPGVDAAAGIKADFLYKAATGEESVVGLDRRKATFLLGTMLGGYNIQPLIGLLDSEETAETAATALAGTVLVYDAYKEVIVKSATNAWAKKVVDAWAAADWFTNRKALADKITVTIFKVEGETNTDDFSPASEAWSRPDIPLHAKAMLVAKAPDALDRMEELKGKGHQLAFVGDVVGTGSSRK